MILFFFFSPAMRGHKQTSWCEQSCDLRKQKVTQIESYCTQIWEGGEWWEAAYKRLKGLYSNVTLCGGGGGGFLGNWFQEINEKTNGQIKPIIILCVAYSIIMRSYFVSPFHRCIKNSLKSQSIGHILLYNTNPFLLCFFIALSSNFSVIRRLLIFYAFIFFLLYLYVSKYI